MNPGDLPSDASLHERGARRRVTFDPTVNLGHLLTFAGFLISGFAAYTTVDRRITVLEVAQSAGAIAQRERDAVQDQRTRDAVDAVKESTIRIERAVDELRRDRNQR